MVDTAHAHLIWLDQQENQKEMAMQGVLKIKLHLTRMIAALSCGSIQEPSNLLNQILEADHVWGMAHDLATLKMLLGIDQFIVREGQIRMAMLLVADELNRLQCNRWNKAVVGTPLAEQRNRAFRAGKKRVFCHPDGGSYMVERLSG
jgi:hypothetical protein